MLYGTARKITAGPGDEQFSAEHSPQGFQVFDPLRHRNEVSLGPAPSCGPQRGALGHKRLPEPHAQRHCCPAPSEAGASGEGGNCAKKPPKRCLAVGSSTALWHRAPPPCPCHQHGPCPWTWPAPPEGRVRRRRFSILLRHFPVWLQQRFPSQHSTSWPSVAILTTAPRPDTTRSVRNGPVLLYPSQIPFFPLPAPAWLPCSYCAAYRNAFCGNYTLS